MNNRFHHSIPDGNFIKDVIVHFECRYPNTVEADIYEAADEGVYMSGSLGCHTHNEFNDDCRLLMTLTVCWRGTWDERAYPKDEEYWTEEMMDLGRITETLLPVLKQKAREGFNFTHEDHE